MFYDVGGVEGDFECEVWRWVVKCERCIVKCEGWCRKVNGVGDVVVCAFVGGDARGAVGDGYRWKVKGEWCNVGEVECDGEGEAEVWKVIGVRWKVKCDVVGLVLAFIPYVFRSFVCCCMVSPFTPFFWPISFFLNFSLFVFCVVFCMFFYFSSSVFVSFVVFSLFFFCLLVFFWFLFALSWRGVWSLCLSWLHFLSFCFHFPFSSALSSS